MSFVVGENHGPWKYTRIHRALPHCGHARDGGHATRNTRWYPLAGGTYATYAEAHAAAVHTGQPGGPYDCWFCWPAPC